MGRILRGTGICLALTLAACGGQGGGGSGANSSSATLQAQQLQELNQLPYRQGEINLNYSKVDSVDEYFVSPYLPIAVTTTSGSNGGGIIVDPPPPQHFVRVSGTQDLTLEDSNGAAVISPIRSLYATAVFSEDNASGTACYQSAQTAFMTNQELDIKGHGIIVQIPYPYCPPYAMCAEPLTASAETSTIASVSVNTPVLAPLPPWIYAYVGVYFQTLDSCTVGGPSTTP